VSIRLRLILSFFLLVGLGFYFLTDWVVDDLRVRYKESIEEVLIDTSQVLSALIASEIQQEQIRSTEFNEAFQPLKRRLITEKIHPLTERDPDARVYVTNNEGLILFDSRSAANEGQDYSKWRDVSFSLKGQYGARFSVEELDGEKIKMLYVAAPILSEGEVLGVISVGGIEEGEKALAEKAKTLATWIGSEIQKKRLKLDNFKEAFQDVKSGSLRVHIYQISKTQVDLRVYVTDDTGKVLFDSNGKDEGKDYSQWRDVYLTLRGKYGARSTLEDPNNPRSSIMYVASPIKVGEKISGVVTVGKPTSRVDYLLKSASPQIWMAAGVASISVILLGMLFSTWITRPLRLLTRYAKDVRDGKKRSLPRLGKNEIGVMGNTFEEMREALEGKKYVENYIQSLTHELKSPISAIKGAAELLDEEMSAEDRTRFLENIQIEVSRMQEIVDRLLELAALEGRTELKDVESIPLFQLLEELRKNFDSQLTRKDLKWVNQIPQQLKIRGERFLIQQALSNLLQNAVNFSPPGGSIVSKAREDVPYVEILIEDEGMGIPNFAHQRIFDRFYSLEQPDTKKKSSGLGLSFVKEIASLHKGTIRLENLPEKGVRAVLRIRRDPISAHG
jgi:Signal transduction histidine kinase